MILSDRFPLFGIMLQRPYDTLPWENRMFLRLALAATLAAAIFAAAGQQPARAEDPSPAVTPAKPDAPQATPAQPGDPFGEDATLTAKPIVYIKGTGTWDNAFETITTSFKTLKAYVAKEGLKVDGQTMTIFTATDDTGFQFQAAIPVAEPPKTPPKGEISVGTSPEGHALKFVHRGSYDGLDNTYEAITNYLDEHKLEAKDMFIEKYLTDPLTADEDHLVVDVYVLVK
jgi:effector-binding domain-containing protein